MYATGTISINFPNLSYLEEMPSQIQPFEGNEIKVKFWILEIVSTSRMLKFSQTKSLLWICDSKMLGTSSKNILPKGGLMVIYHGIFRNNLRTNPSCLRKSLGILRKTPSCGGRLHGVGIPLHPIPSLLYPACACSERLVIWHLKMKGKKNESSQSLTIHGIGI